jgi:hypothetical protein
MINITEIKCRANIRDVWGSLAGPELRGNRGQAFWRNGTGYNIAIYPQSGRWHDFVTGDGGDVVALVEMVRQCNFQEAVEWLAALTGTSAPEQVRHKHVDTDWVTDLRWATWWGMTAEILAEQTLEEMEPWDLRRADLTAVLRAIRRGGAALVTYYRSWRRQEPVMTRGMALAGQRRDARLQRRLALWLRRYLDETS